MQLTFLDGLHIWTEEYLLLERVDLPVVSVDDLKSLVDHYGIFSEGIYEATMVDAPTSRRACTSKEWSTDCLRTESRC